AIIRLCRRIGGGRFMAGACKTERVSSFWGAACNFNHAHGMGFWIFVERVCEFFQKKWLTSTDLPCD
ncbi:MAG: hypothetical protein Q8L87_07160, partial [Anaerolineales bacterium]|nr:hypothetical protein [Anaerolineales bacterium]